MTDATIHGGPRDWLATALAPLFWGTMPALAMLAAAPGHPLLTATVRSLGAGLAFLLLARAMPPRAWYGRILVLGVVNIALTFALFFVSAARLPGGITTTLMAFAPFWAALLSWPLLSQRPRPVQLLLILVGVAGVFLLVGASASLLDPVGIAAGAGAASCMGCGIVLIKKWGRPAPLQAFTCWQLLTGGLILAVLTLVWEDMPATIAPLGVAAYLYLALACTALAYALWFRGIERIGPQRTSMLLLLVPLVAISIDTLCFGKRLSALQGVGAALVLACLYLDVRLGLKAATRQPAATALRAPAIAAGKGVQ